MSKLVRRFKLGQLWEYGKNESWYSDMALKGLHLQSVGNFLVTFEQGEPKKTKYRIEILEENPSQEQLDIYKEYGWELVASNQMFYIFSSPEELNAPELHTDPMEQSFTFKMLNKQLKKNMILITILFLSFSSQIFNQFFLQDEPYLFLITRRSFTYIMVVIPYMYVLFESIRGYYVVKKIKDSLQNGIPLNHNQKWKLSYFLSSVVYIILIVMVLTAIFMPIYEVIKTDSYASSKALDNLPIIRITDIEDTPVYDYSYPYINKIRTFYQNLDVQRKPQVKGLDNFYRFIARTPQNVDKLPSTLRHFLGADLSFSSSSVASAFASCSAVISK